MKFTDSVRLRHVPDTSSHLGLAAELPVGADLLRHARDLGRERVELVDHGVHGLLQLEDLALGVDRDLLRQVAVRDGGRDLGDVADLIRQVRRHRVHVLREAAPGAGHVLHLGLAAELALGTHLARDARDLRRERAQTVDHLVDRVRERGHLALGLDA